MKKLFLIKMFLFTLAGILISCEALLFNYSVSQTWLIPEDAPEETGGALTLIGIKVDRAGGWDSVEREITALAPLYFWNSGRMVVAAEKGPAYAAEIQAREREFNLGWRTKRSLAVEVRIWADKDAPKAGDPVNERKLPAAVGRVVATGEKSFSSSETIGRLLEKAIKNAAKELAAYEGRK